MSARYDTIGRSYSAGRREDPRFAAAIQAALGNAERVVNIGAGAGSYEPRDGRSVLAVEPSDVMLRQRADAAPAVRGVAEHLPFVDGSFDAALALLTVHHWHDLGAGLREMRRVAEQQVVLTWDPHVTQDFWLVEEYLPEIAELEAGWDPIDGIVDGLDVREVRVVPVPRNCVDGFLGAYWCRPEAYLDPEVRASMSGIALLDQGVVDHAIARLAADLTDGSWSARHSDLLALDEDDVGYRLVVAG